MNRQRRNHGPEVEGGVGCKTVRMQCECRTLICIDYLFLIFSYHKYVSELYTVCKGRELILIAV